MADKPLYVTTLNEELDIGAMLSEGGIHAKIFLGVQGNDIEAAKLALENTIFNKLDKEENIKVLTVRMFDILKQDNAEFFSGVSEIELITEDFRWFVNIVLRYGPSAVEIIEPDEVKLGLAEMHSIIADSADFSHMYSQQIIDMFKDPERKALYDKMISEQN